MGCQKNLLMPKPNLHLNPDFDPFKEDSVRYQNNEIDILYETDRLPDRTEGESMSYSSERSSSLAIK